MFWSAKYSSLISYIALGNYSITKRISKVCPKANRMCEDTNYIPLHEYLFTTKSTFGLDKQANNQGYSLLEKFGKMFTRIRVKT